ncbi:PQQ-dependent sugar dehydrogenase [Akkermansiaceae bacterium]|nr:PQQ-dependent sugar dehydrogenase [Akkermansiaceae bacterium]MDB4541293.1 PQQ-dependent sugar dehydrogenase [Akkermansiaceae bacterium]
MLKTLSSSLFLICGLSAVPITLTPVTSELERPVDFTVAPGDQKHFYVTEQNGKILKLDAATGKKLGIVLDLTGYVSRGHNEEGLLGLAFSPSFEKDQRLYTYYTRGDKKNRQTFISRFLMQGEKVERDSEEVLLTYVQDFGNHNGGWIAFGPDGYLYIGAGDGGNANDPKKRAQDLSNPLGSLLRIDVSGEKGYVIPDDNPFIEKEDAKPEIFSYGLRNPWRCSFDMETGDLWIADVGQNHWEEINFIPAGEARGVNFGWRPREGTHKTPKEGVGGDSPAAEHKPIYEYGHDVSKPTGGLSISGGYVHRGERKELNGRYFFADYVSMRIWSLKQEGKKMSDFVNHNDSMKLPEGKTLGPVSSFGQDHAGEVYVLDFTGTIYRIE